MIYLLQKLKAHFINLQLRRMPWKVPTVPNYNRTLYKGLNNIWYMWVTDLRFRRVINDKVTKLGISPNNVKYVYRREIYENK